MNIPRKIVMAVIVALLGAGGVAGYKIVKTSQQTGAEVEVHKAVRVVDGDTFKIETDRRVRLLGIDAPERGECFYEESTEALREAMEGKLVELEKDKTGTDKYGRLLRYVTVPSEDVERDDLFVNDFMVREGYAKDISSPPDNRYRDLLASAGQEAEREERGIWAECEVERSDAESLRETDAKPPSEECNIKGNISEKGYGQIYLVPGCDNYNRVKIDLSKGERYFCSEAEAEEAGFRRAINCP